MARKPENSFITGVHKYIPAQIHCEKMANPYRGGTADVWYDGKRDHWVEYKFIVVPKRAETMIDIPALLSTLQKDWLTERYNNGRTVAVVVGSAKGGVIFEGIDWLQPINTLHFQRRLNTRKDIAEWITRRCL